MGAPGDAEAGAAATAPAVAEFVERAPAKLNLSLAVLARRPDGYHDIESLMVPVDLHDTLHVRPLAAGRFELRVRFSGEIGRTSSAAARDVPVDDTNLVVRAARLLAAEAGVTAGLAITLVKRVPARAGLGGGSSDAAAVLRGAARAWGLDWPAQRLAAIGARVGSDVPWFFAGGAATVAGRGERVVPVAPLPPLAVVIACPLAGLSTAAVYARCVPDPGGRGVAARLAAALATGGLAAALPLLHNALEPPARELCPDVDRLLAALARAGAVAPRMTGSGSACFALARTLHEARGIAARLQAAGPPWGTVFVARIIAPRPPAPRHG